MYLGKSHLKQKVSILLSSSVLRQVDRMRGGSRSAVIERILRVYFHDADLRKRSARDLRRINAAAERLNSEAADVLRYQTLDI